MSVSGVSSAVGGQHMQAGMNRAAAEGSAAEEAHESPAAKAREQQAASVQSASASAPSSSGAGKILNVTA